MKLRLQSCKSRLSNVRIAFCFAMLLISASFVAAQEPTPSVAAKYFSDVELVNQDGQKRHFYSDVLKDKVVIINAHVSRPWEGQVNDTFAAGVPKYKNAVLLDWHSYGGAHPEFFYDDGIHLRPEGAAAYANFVARALSGEGSP